MANRSRNELLINQTLNAGYNVWFAGVYLPTVTAASRSLSRAQISNRWIPLGSIAASHSAFSSNFQIYEEMITNNQTFLYSTESFPGLPIIQAGQVIAEELLNLFLSKSNETLPMIRELMSTDELTAYDEFGCECGISDPLVVVNCLRFSNQTFIPDSGRNVTVWGNLNVTKSIYVGLDLQVNYTLVAESVIATEVLATELTATVVSTTKLCVGGVCATQIYNGPQLYVTNVDYTTPTKIPANRCPGMIEINVMMAGQTQPTECSGYCWMICMLNGNPIYSDGGCESNSYSSSTPSALGFTGSMYSGSGSSISKQFFVSNTTVDNLISFQLCQNSCNVWYGKYSIICH